MTWSSEGAASVVRQLLLQVANERAVVWTLVVLTTGAKKMQTWTNVMWIANHYLVRKLLESFHFWNFTSYKMKTTKSYVSNLEPWFKTKSFTLLGSLDDHLINLCWGQLMCFLSIVCPTHKSLSMEFCPAEQW